MSEAPRRRPVTDEPEGAGERPGCLKIAALLGIVIGIPVGVFGLPLALNSIFDEPTIAVGDRYLEGGLRIEVVSVETVAGPPRRVLVTLAVLAEEPWAPSLEDFELALVEPDERIAASSSDPRLSQIAEGRETTITLRFSVSQAGSISPEALHLTDPKVRFELPEPLP